MPVTAAQQIWPGLGLVLADLACLSVYCSRFGLVLTEISSAQWVTTSMNVCSFSGRCACFLWKATISTFTIFVECHVLSRKLGVPLWVDFMNWICKHFLVVICYLRAKNSSKINAWWEIESSISSANAI